MIGFDPLRRSSRHESLRWIVIALGLPAWGGIVLADEGMWVFDKLPLRQLKEKYGFEPPPGWVEHLQSSAVRFNSGGSGSFVSADGLVMTNHHVGADTLQKISTPEKDYYKTGFHAKTHAEEVKAPDLELNVLVGIEDVTDRVNAARQARHGRRRGQRQAPGGDGRRSRRNRSTRPASGATSSPSTRAASTHLYTFKKYTDVRLVFAPEFDIAFFGGDPDNFEYPRYDLDVCFFRAYEDGKPAQAEALPEVEPRRLEGGRAVFVAGHPGRTSRLFTVAHLEYLRDRSFPLVLDAAPRPRGVPARIRQARPRAVPPVEGRPLRHPEQPEGPRRGLQGAEGRRPDGPQGRRREGPPRPDRRRPREEGRLRRGLGQDRRRRRRSRPRSPSRTTSSNAGSPSTRTSSRSPGPSSGSPPRRPSPTPTGSANTASRPSSRSSWHLFSEAPIYPEFEKAKLARSLAFWKAKMPDDPMVERVLRGRTPEQAAADAGRRLEARRRRGPQGPRRRGHRRRSRPATTR